MARLYSILWKASVGAEIFSVTGLFNDYNKSSNIVCSVSSADAKANVAVVLQGYTFYQHLNFYKGLQAVAIVLKEVYIFFYESNFLPFGPLVGDLYSFAGGNRLLPRLLSLLNPWLRIQYCLARHVRKCNRNSRKPVIVITATRTSSRSSNW